MSPEPPKDLPETAVAALERALGRGRIGDIWYSLTRDVAALDPRHRPWFWGTAAHRLIRLSPSYAAQAYGRARDAETALDDPPEPAGRRAEAEWAAARGILGAKHVRDHQIWLAGAFPPAEAHAAFTSFVRVLAGAGDLPADLPTRLRASAKPLGLDLAEDAATLEAALTARPGAAHSDKLIEAVTKVFARVPASPAFRDALAGPIPATGESDGSAWLRLLETAGTLAAFRDGSLTPPGGLLPWIATFPYRYSFRGGQSGVTQQRTCRELLQLIDDLAPRLRGGSVEIHKGRYYPLFDSDLLDALLAAGVRVADPGPKQQLVLWREGQYRDLKATAADPVFGPRLEGRSFTVAPDPRPKPAPAAKSAPSPATGPVDVAARLEAELKLSRSWAAALTEPSDAAFTLPRAVLRSTEFASIEILVRTDKGAPGARLYANWIRPNAYWMWASALAWAFTELPVGAAPAAPALTDRLLAELAEPDVMVIVERSALAGLSRERIAELFGPAAFPVLPGPPPRDPAWLVPPVYDDGCTVVDGKGSAILLRGAELGRAAEHAARYRELGLDDLALRLERTLVYTEGLARMAERARTGPVPEGGYEANPLLSTPDLVAEVVAAQGLAEDAAVLLLQLLALPRPTDKNVRLWNGWTPARHKQAQAGLADAELVVEARRPRSGRTAFAPGGWQVLKAPELPVETAKFTRLLARLDDKGKLDGPFTRLLPTVPLHELFRDVWRSTQRG